MYRTSASILDLCRGGKPFHAANELGDPAPAPRVLPRPQRWAAAVATLVALQDEYRAWLERLPEALEGSPTAEKLQAITELDLDELQAIDPPRGYGRD